MAISVTLLKDGNDVFGGRNRIQHASVSLDNSYPTGGYPLAASFFFGAKAVAANIWNVFFGNAGTTGGGAYRYYYDIPNGKLMVYRSAGFTPAGTNAASTVTGNAVVVGGGVGEAIGINPDTNAGVLSKAAATNRTIPIATFLGGNLTAPAQTFTGAAVAAGALVQVANATDLSLIVGLRMTIFGR